MLKRLLCSLVGLLALVQIAAAATLLPNGEQYFTDQNGLPLAGGKVFFYVPNTTTAKDTYQDSGQTVLNSNPVILDGSGRAIIYGAGSYRQVVEDSNNSIIWDQLTADTSASGSSYGGVSGGSANAQTVLAGSFTSQAGQSIQFVAGFTNTSSLSLTPAGGSPIAVLKDTTTGPIALSGGEVVTGNSYIVVYDGALGAFHLVAYPNPGIGAPVTIASAATTNIGTISTHNASITGTTGITSFGSGASTAAPFYLASFTGILTITQGSAIKTPSGGNVITATGTAILLQYLGTGNWQILSVSPVGHSLIGVQTFCASGCTHTSGATYAADTGTSGCEVEVQAAGGGSGGSANTAAGHNALSGGGSGGSYAKVYFAACAVNGDVITIGAVGAAGSVGNNAGGAGAATSAGAHISCPGGTGGPGGGDTSGVVMGSVNTVLPALCTISGGTTTEVNTAGGVGFAGIMVAAGQGDTQPGGASMLGVGGPTQSGAGAGNPGSGNGSGPSGSFGSNAGGALAGTAGQPGIVIIREFN